MTRIARLPTAGLLLGASFCAHAQATTTTTTTTAEAVATPAPEPRVVPTSATDDLLDRLRAKGILSEDEARVMRAKFEAERQAEVERRLAEAQARPAAGVGTGTNLTPSVLSTAAPPTSNPATVPMPANTTVVEAPKKHWYDALSIRGYLQVRNSDVIGGDKNIDLWSDRSVGEGAKNFLIRRARVVLSGNIGDSLGIYIQPDLASTAGTTNNVAQLRDAYGDWFLTKDRVHRLRVGQSKVPYGFENMQSSQNRLALDRADALNSAVRDERDLGAFYYFTPSATQAQFDEIQKKNLKHSGNYGLFGIGVYNGQGANRTEANGNYHAVARLTYPYKFANGQIVEGGVQGYTGRYAVTTGAYRRTATATTTPTIQAGNVDGFKDRRVGASFIWYPQPFGLQAEWNWGRTPGLDIQANQVRERSLQGGYVQGMFMTRDVLMAGDIVIPFVKWQYYDGANKAETNAPDNKVNDIEAGVEWQFTPQVELAAVYHKMRRNNLVTNNRLGTPDYQRFDSDVLRFQLQFNY